MVEPTHELIRQIYGAVGRPESWPGVVQTIVDTCQCDLGFIQWLDLPSGSSRRIHTPSAPPPDSLATYLSKYSCNNPALSLALGRDAPVGSVFSSRDSMDQRKFVKTDFYKDVFRPAGVDYYIGAHLARTTQHFVFIALLQSARHRGLGEQGLEFCRGIAPHLVQAVSLRNELDRATLDGIACQSILDCFSAPVFAVDGSARIVVANDAAEQALREPDCPLVARSGRLTARTHADTAALHQLVGACAATANARGSFAGQVMPLWTGSSERTLLRVLPCISEGLGIASQALVLVTLVAPEVPSTPAAQELCHGFGLTTREAQLASRLYATSNLRECAVDLGITHETARSYLKNILRKCGVRSQSALARVLARFVEIRACD